MTDYYHKYAEGTTDEDMKYLRKYQKYKQKYYALKMQQKGGNGNNDEGPDVSFVGNHIYFYTNTNPDSVMQLQVAIKAVGKEMREEGKIRPIYLHISSEGGDVLPALSAIDQIEQSDIPIHTIVEGGVSSTASLMATSGKKRYIRPHGMMLIHQLSSSFGGTMKEIEDEMKNLATMTKQIKSVYLKRTQIPEEELDEYLKSDIWWTAEECVEKGLVDEILTDDKQLDVKPKIVKENVQITDSPFTKVLLTSFGQTKPIDIEENLPY